MSLFSAEPGQKMMKGKRGRGWKGGEEQDQGEGHSGQGHKMMAPLPFCQSKLHMTL